MKLKRDLKYHLWIVIFIPLLFACGHNNNPSAPSLFGDNFWRSSNGPFGGSVSAIAMNNAGDLFVGTAAGGVFRSQDNGDSWQNMDLDLVDPISFIDFDAASNIYVSGRFRLNQPRFIKSANNGQSWEDIEIDFLSGIHAFAISSGGYIVVGSGGNDLARSKDNGVTWEQLSTPSGRLTKLKFSSNNYLFFGDSGGGLYRSTDLGETWIKVSSDSIVRAVSSIVEKPNDELLIGGKRNTFVTDSEGRNWREILSHAGNFIAINSKGTTFVANRSGKLFRSEDDGETWQEINTGMRRLQYRRLLITPRDHIFLGTFDELGLLRSKDNGNSFEEVTEGITSAWIDALHVDSNDEIFAYNRHGRFFYSNDYATTWQMVADNMPWHVRNLTTNSSGDIFAGSFHEGVVRSRDRGYSWEKIYDADAPALVVDSKDILYAANYSDSLGVFRTFDNGDTWSFINNGLRIKKVWCLAVDVQDNIYAGTKDGLFFLEKNKTQWVELPNTLTDPFPVYGIAIHSNGDIFTASRNTTFYFDRQQAIWFKTQLDLGNFNATNIAINKSQIFVGSGLGVHTSFDEGKTWTKINDGLHDPAVRASFGFDSMGHIYVGNIHGGVSRSNRPVK